MNLQSTILEYISYGWWTRSEYIQRNNGYVGYINRTGIVCFTHQRVIGGCKIVCTII